MKKYVVVLFVCLSLLSLTACGDDSASGNSLDGKSTEKGTRENPYTLNDTISFETYAYGEKFDITLSFEEVIDNQGVRELWGYSQLGDYDEFIPAIMTIEGQYQDVIKQSDIIQFDGLDDRMAQMDIMVFDREELRQVYNEMYTDMSYDLYLRTCNCVREIKYLQIKYYNKENEKQNIYLLIE